MFGHICYIMMSSWDETLYPRCCSSWSGKYLDTCTDFQVSLWPCLPVSTTMLNETTSVFLQGGTFVPISGLTGRAVYQPPLPLNGPYLPGSGPRGDQFPLPQNVSANLTFTGKFFIYWFITCMWASFWSQIFSILQQYFYFLKFKLHIVLSIGLL